jgi:hypothetical protein
MHVRVKQLYSALETNFWYNTQVYTWLKTPGNGPTRFALDVLSVPGGLTQRGTAIRSSACRFKNKESVRDDGHDKSPASLIMAAFNTFHFRLSARKPSL